MSFIKNLNGLKYVAWTAVLACFFIFLSTFVSATNNNLIANQSVETSDPVNPNQPQNWKPNSWGTNSTTMAYQNGGHTGNKSLYINMASRTSGDAKWVFDPVAATPGDTYTYSDYYQSSIDTELDAQYTDSSGNISYAYLKYVPASPSWSQVSTSFKIPNNIAQVTILHILYSPGWLQTDDFSLTDNGTPTAPQVSLSSPSNNATLSGTQNIAATATDAQGISSVQFKLDGNSLGPAITSSPYSYSWDTTSASNGSHAITAVATNITGQTTTSSTETVTVNNSTAPPPPGTNLVPNPSAETADATGKNPANWSSNKWGTNTTTMIYQNSGHTGSKSLYINMSAQTSGDAKWFFNPVSVTPNTSYSFSDYYMSSVTTELDAQFTDTSGNITYGFLKTVPAASNWSQVSASFTTPANVAKATILHIIYSAGWLQTDDASLMVPTVPIISLTAPSANSTISGNTTVSATVSAATGVKNVQFKLDGNNLGSAVTTSPYQINWDTTKTTNGTHTISAIVTSLDGKTATSQTVSVDVSNLSGNMVPNPSVETVNPSNTSKPQDWTHGSWGTNTTAFSYLASGHSGTRSVKTQITSYTNGAAYWYPSANIAVTAGQMYDFSDYYESNIISEIDAGFTMSDGSQKSVYIGDAFASPNSWTKFDKQFQVPAGAVSVTFYHNIYSVGWVTTDDYSLAPFSYQALKRPIVSLTFDDGYESFYKNGLPLLEKYGVPSTDYIISGVLGQDPAYMTSTQVKQLYNNKQDVESHTVSHPDLVTLTATQQDQELKNSQAYLQSLLGIPIKGLATPYGSANNQVLTDAAKYYSYVRGVEPGYNAKNNFNPYNILVQNIKVNTPVSQVQQWVQQAIATNTWLVLVYHQVDPTLTNQTAEPYNTYPADLDSELAYIKSTGVTVETMAQAFSEINSQL